MITFDEAIRNIATSINNEQEALSNLLNEEALKIDKFIELGATPEELLEVNNSVTSMIDSSNIFNDVLKDKLNLIVSYLD